MTTKKKATTTTEPATEKPKPEGMQIIAMQVDNIKRVKFARIRPKGTMIEVAGGNGEGKSSVLDAIDFALTGTTSIPSMPIRKGQRVGQVQIDLGDFKVVRDFTKIEGGKTDYLTKLHVYGKNREQFPTPQSILDGLMGRISFDPLEFIRMEPKKQFQALSEIAGVDVSKIDAEKLAAYADRRETGRDLERVKARLTAMPKPDPDLPAEPIDTAAIANKLQGAAEHNSAIATAKAEQYAKLERAKQDDERIKAIEGEIAQLQQRIEQLQKERGEVEWNAAALRQQAGAMTFDEPIVTADLALELEKANATNRKLEQRRAYDAAEKELNAAQTLYDQFDAKVRAADEARAKAIADAKMPLEGLTIGDGQVLYNEIPFEQASNAEQIRVSVALAMASNPKLRVLRIKDGSLLDGKSLDLIRTMATDQNYQVWIERVESTDPAAVVMEDGEAHGTQTEQPAPAKK